MGTDNDQRVLKKVTQAAKRAGIDEVYVYYNMRKDWWDVTLYFWEGDSILRGDYHMDSIIDDADVVVEKAIENAKRGYND
jgi:hypothetical protein